MLNPKQIQNPKQKNQKLIFFIICILYIGFFSSAYALDLTKLKTEFLKMDYKAAIIEGEKIIAKASGDSYGLDELYYILGLSYLKDGNALRASDIFEIILKEFENSTFKEQVLLGLGDSYFVRQDFTKAKDYYLVLAAKSNAKFKPQAYYRLAQCALKLGDKEEAQDYLEKIKQESPLNLEMQLNKDLAVAPQVYYAVQVGAFSHASNAKKLTQKLITQGYPAYTQELNSSYRVRAGKFQSLREAQELEAKLLKEGYSTKIIP
jgi:TolA-binding protein